MTSSKLSLINLILREMLTSDRTERCPEPSSVMRDPRNVESFHDQGGDRDALIPVYHFNALAISALLPLGGTLIDLGSGSGQFLSHLARCRPDCRIVGLDLSEEMVSVGERSLRTSGLDAMVRLHVGDMTSFSRDISERVDVVSSIFAFHHLPSSESLIRCLSEIKEVRKQWGCGIWIFDHTRPRSIKTAKLFPIVFTPEAPESFRRDSMNSLLASFSFRELTESIDAASPGTFNHECSRILRLYQIHWLKSDGGRMAERQAFSCKVELSRRQYSLFRQLRMLFKRAPF